MSKDNSGKAANRVRDLFLSTSRETETRKNKKRAKPPADLVRDQWEKNKNSIVEDIENRIGSVEVEPLRVWETTPDVEVILFLQRIRIQREIDLWFTVSDAIKDIQPNLDHLSDLGRALEQTLTGLVVMKRVVQTTKIPVTDWAPKVHDT